MLDLLRKTIAQKFYIQHAGLFLFVFYLLFGTVQASDLLSFHKTLLITICASPLFLAGCGGLWVLYALKCLLFVRKQSNLNDHRFLGLLSSAPKPFQLRTWTAMYSFLLLPVLIYAALLIFMAITYGYYWNAAATLTFSAALLAAMVSYSYLTTTYNFIYRRPFLALSVPEFKKPYWTWPILYVIQQQTIMFVACKVLAFIFFKAILWVFTDVGNDTRVTLLALLAAVLTHIVLISVLVKHETSSLAFRKSLPIPVAKSMLSSLLTLTILFSPELLLYCKTVHFNGLAVLQGFLFGLAGLFSFKTLLSGLKQDSDYAKFILFLFAASSMSILAHLVLPFSAALLLLSMIYFYYGYYRIDLKEINSED